MPVASFPVRTVVAAMVSLVLAAGCSSSADPSDATGQYLAIGDSYSAGFRPAVDGGAAENTADGFAWRVAEATGLDLVNVSCSGITTVAFVGGGPCGQDLRGPDGPDRAADSEAATLLDHVEGHAGQIELVTVVLGANDLRACSFDRGWRACVAEVLPRVRRALDTLLSDLRDRLGPEVPIVGLTYPDVWLGAPVLQPDSADAPHIADASVEMFRTMVNPTLRETYAKHGARLADSTEEFGAYIPPHRTTETTEFGTIPARAAHICAETYYCTLGDPHPTPEGHERIADLVLATLEAQ